MTALHQTALVVAHGALLDLETAKTALNQLESLLFSMTTGSAHPSHVSNLIEIAWNLVADAANNASCSYETISRQLDELAPQNAQSENVARISLAEFATMGQTKAGRHLGVNQASIAKALRVGRKIFVIDHLDGTFSAIEEKAFPGQRDRAEVQP